MKIVMLFSYFIYKHWLLVKIAKGGFYNVHLPISFNAIFYRSRNRIYELILDIVLFVLHQTWIARAR